MRELELLCCHKFLPTSVIVRDLNTRGMTCIPLEADAPLLVHADAVFALAITLERLELVRDRDQEILQIFRSVQLLQLHQSSLLDIVRKLLRILTLPDLFSLFVLKRLD